MKHTYHCLTLLTLLGFSVNPLPAAPDQEKSPSQNIFQQLDKNSDGTVTADEVPGEKSRFFDHLIRQGDQNKDGKLTKAEFEAGLKKEDQKFPAGAAPDGNRNRGPRDFKMFLSRLDRNGDKKISKEELPEPLRERLEPLFQRLNRDEISLDEFEQFGNMFRGRRPGGKPPENRTQKPEEMQASAEQFFDRLDTNQDGKLTLDEAPVRGKLFVRRLLDKSGKDVDAELTKAEFNREISALQPDRRRLDTPKNDNEMKRPEMRAPEKKQTGEPSRRRPGSNFFQTVDLDHDGKLSKYELNQIDRVFDRLDRNRNGYLELEEVVGQRRGRNNPIKIEYGQQKLKLKTETEGKKASE